MKFLLQKEILLYTTKQETTKSENVRYVIITMYFGYFQDLFRYINS